MGVAALKSEHSHKGAKGSKSGHYLHADKGIDAKVQAPMTAWVFGHNCGVILKSNTESYLDVLISGKLSRPSHFSLSRETTSYHDHQAERQPRPAALSKAGPLHRSQLLTMSGDRSVAAKNQAVTAPPSDPRNSSAVFS